MGPWSYFYSFLQSNIIELPVYFYFYYRYAKAPWYKPILATSFANYITLPLVFFGFMGFGLSYLWAIITAQAFTIISETLIHKYTGSFSWLDAFNASLLANFMSWQLAPILTFAFFYL